MLSATALSNNKKIFTMRRTVKKCVVICLIFLITIITVFCWSNTFYQNSHHKEYSRNIETILWWTHLLPNYDTVKTCGIYKCHFTIHRSYLNQSATKAIVFYGSDINITDLPVPRLNHHLWALFHEESPKNLPYIQHDNVLKHFNYTATFSRYADFPLTLQSIKDYDTLRSKRYVVPIGDKSKLRKDLAPIAFIQSICDDMSGRNEYVGELMKYIPIDSYGKCLHNTKLPSSLKNDYLTTIDSDELYKFLARYKFIIAYENGVCNDYITEKFWRPLIIGSIPIYFGSPTIKDWLPNKKSAILISDFNSPRDLANFIKKIDENDQEYNKYLDHKYSQSSPISNILLKNTLINRDYTTDSVFEEFECFLCKKMYNINDNQYATKLHYDCGNNLIYPKMSRKVDSIWGSVLKHNKYVAQVLDRLLRNNRNYTQQDFDIEIKNYENDHRIRNKI